MPPLKTAMFSALGQRDKLRHRLGVAAERGRDGDGVLRLRQQPSATSLIDSGDAMPTFGLHAGPLRVIEVLDLVRQHFARQAEVDRALRLRLA